MEKLYNDLTTVVTVNTWSLFKRSGKPKMAIRYDETDKNSLYMHQIVLNTRHMGYYDKIYLYMPFEDYIKFIFKNWKYRKIYGYCFTSKDKYIVEQGRLLNDALKAFEVEDYEIFEKIYDEFFGEGSKQNV